MNSVANSVTSRRKLREARPVEGTALGRRLIRGAEQILAHQRGEIEAEVYTLPGPMDVVRKVPATIIQLPGRND